MAGPTIGVDIDDLRLGVKAGLRTAAAMDFRFVELAAVAGDLAPENLSSSGRRHLLHLVRSHGLELACLAADLPGLRLTDPKTVGQHVERTCRIIDLAADLKVPIVTASVGAFTHPDTGEVSPHALEAFKRIGEFADSRGRIYAPSPSYERSDRFGGLLEMLGCPSLKGGYDPAEMVIRGTNPISGIERIISHIVVVHGRDGTVGGLERSGYEVALGQGDVDWATVLAALQAAEFPGPLILRRRDSQSPVEDIRRARQTLRRML